MSKRPRYPSELKERFIVRMPDGLRDRIKRAAATNKRPMNAEILATLEEAYPAPEPEAPDMLEIMDMLQSAKSPDEFEQKAREANRQLEAAGSLYRVDMVSPIPGQIAFSRTPQVPVPAEDERFVSGGRIVKKKG